MRCLTKMNMRQGWVNERLTQVKRKDNLPANDGVRGT